MNQFYSIVLQAMLPDMMIPIGKIVIGAGRPGPRVLSIAHDSLSIAMSSMVFVVPRMICMILEVIDFWSCLLHPNVVAKLMCKSQNCSPVIVLHPVDVDLPACEDTL